MPPKSVLNPLANGKIQGLFKAFSVFQGKFYFQGLFETVLYIQVCANPATLTLCMQGNCSCCFVVCCLFTQLIFFKNSF